jgi:UDP-glucose 4-epimerase
MRVLVVGGAGYIGSHICKTLAARGDEPVVFDNLSAGHSHAVKWGPLFRGDIRVREDLARGCCQTNANRSPKSTIDLNSGCKLAPFGQGSGSVLLECFSAV